MEYHVFLKTQKKQDKETKTWCYWYYKPGTRKQVTKVCKGCKTKKAAEAYVDSLPNLSACSTLISEIAKDMFVPHSLHYERRKQFGKSIKLNTMTEARRFVDFIIQQFGNKKLNELKPAEVLNFLIKQDRSSSWKNQFLGILKEIYSEAQYQGFDVIMPSFQKFRNNPKKADVFTTEEIAQLFIPENFESEEVYLLFILTLTGGLRISEARAFRPCQILGDNLVIVDGFMDRKNKDRNNYCKTGSDENPRWRVAIIPQKTELLLIDYIRRNNIARNDYLFKFDGKPFRIEYLRNLFERAKKIAKIDSGNRKLTMHSMRYTYVTRMRSIYDTDIVRKMVGHTSTEMTEYYTRASIEAATAALLPVAKNANRFFL